MHLQLGAPTSHAALELLKGNQCGQMSSSKLFDSHRIQQAMANTRNSTNMKMLEAIYVSVVQVTNLAHKT
jgi:hypothetical protein